MSARLPRVSVVSGSVGVAVAVGRRESISDTGDFAPLIQRRRTTNTTIKHANASLKIN